MKRAIKNTHGRHSNLEAFILGTECRKQGAKVMCNAKASPVSGCPAAALTLIGMLVLRVECSSLTQREARKPFCRRVDMGLYSRDCGNTTLIHCRPSTLKDSHQSSFLLSLLHL